jgi:hypothetical protein
MPMFIPVIIAFGAVAAGTVTGFAAFAAVAGSLLVAGGQFTGSKDLVKIGSIIGIVGGISGFASSASNAAAPAVSGAVDETAAETARLASQEATAAAGDAAASTTTAAAPAAVPDVSGGVPQVSTPPPNGTPGLTETPATTPNSLADMAARSGLATAGPAPAPAVTGMTPGQTAYNGLEQTTQVPQTPPSGLQTQASQYNASDLSSWWDKAMNAGKDVAKFAKDNPALLKIGGEMLTSMYGPQAEALDYQKSLMERARRNINAPVVLKYTPPGGQ